MRRRKGRRDSEDIDDTQKANSSFTLDVELEGVHTVPAVTSRK